MTAGNGPARISVRAASERERVQLFNSYMRAWGIPFKTAMWKGLVK